MDCPDRERSQWTGDVVNESGEAFYALSESANRLTRKWLHNLAGWQKPDGVIYAPVPSSNWDKELPGQVMASLGYYGLWNYYWYTGDKETLAEVYPAVQRYIALWKKGPQRNRIAARPRMELGRLGRQYRHSAVAKMRGIT